LMKRVIFWDWDSDSKRWYFLVSFGEAAIVAAARRRSNEAWIYLDFGSTHGIHSCHRIVLDIVEDIAEVELYFCNDSEGINQICFLLAIILRPTCRCLKQFTRRVASLYFFRIPCTPGWLYDFVVRSGQQIVGKAHVAAFTF
jgi:hypothetical protein